jgi:hypothetical protein
MFWFIEKFPFKFVYAYVLIAEKLKSFLSYAHFKGGESVNFQSVTLSNFYSIVQRVALSNWLVHYSFHLFLGLQVRVQLKSGEQEAVGKIMVPIEY